MTREEFAALVLDRRSNHPVWFDLPADNKADEQELMNAEEALGAHLPEDYRWFVKEYGGGDFALAVIYSADPESDLYIVSNQPDSMPNFIAVSDNGGGDLFGFPVFDGRCDDSIALLDHESGVVRPTEYGGFLDFVALYAVKQAHAG